MKPATPSSSSAHLQMEVPFSDFDLDGLVSKWSEATGCPPLVKVYVQGRCFELHSRPLMLRSSYLRRKIADNEEIRLPNSFPGGAEIFSQIAVFCYCYRIEINPSNVAALRCAAEFLEMGKEVTAARNLCEKTDLYLTQVALQSWDDTLVILLSCQSLVPAAEDLLIVSRCIESLAFMACMEVFDPEGRNVNNNNVKHLSIEDSQPVNCSRDWWIRDLLDLPLEFFERIVASIRRKGMKEAFVSSAIVMYANKWILSGSVDYEDESKETGVLEGIVGLLPDVWCDKVRIHFLLSLLAEALSLSCSRECRASLEERIASQLELATIDDFLWPPGGSFRQHSGRISKEHLDLSLGVSTSIEVQTMFNIVSMFMAKQMKVVSAYPQLVLTSSPVGQENNGMDVNKIAVVASTWDEYVWQVASDAILSPSRFLEFVEIIPSYARCTHDTLYKAIDTYCMSHPVVSETEKLAICRSLDPRKLSEASCVHIIQSERMPMRVVVQAIHMQQIHTRRLFNSASSSLKSSSATSHPFTSQDLYSSTSSLEEGQPLAQELRRDSLFPGAAAMKAEFEATSMRVKNLEEEIARMRNSLQEGYSKPIKSNSFRHFCNPQQAPEFERRMSSSTNGRRQKPGFVSRILQGLHRYSCRSSRSTKYAIAQPSSKAPAPLPFDLQTQNR